MDTDDKLIIGEAIQLKDVIILFRRVCYQDVNHYYHYQVYLEKKLIYKLLESLQIFLCDKIFYKR